jgi:uncharacterized membrane protein
MFFRCGQIYSALIKLLDGELVGYHMDAGKELGLAKRLYTSDQLFVFVKDIYAFLYINVFLYARSYTNVFPIYTPMYQHFFGVSRSTQR